MSRTGRSIAPRLLPLGQVRRLELPEDRPVVVIGDHHSPDALRLQPQRRLEVDTATALLHKWRGDEEEVGVGPLHLPDEDKVGDQVLAQDRYDCLAHGSLYP